jgi:hypothetical protein
MDKALAYQRDIDQNEASCAAQSEHRLERHQTLCRQDAAIHAAMAAIDTADKGDEAALP